MTEDEAKIKWCPFAKSRAVRAWKEADVFNAAYAANKDGNVSTSCIASECMAFRWIEDGKASGYFADGTSVEGDSALADRKGYCGLAGKP